TGRDRVILAGHSLGGTLAAIHAALQPQRIAGLALIDAPVVFSERGRLERAVRAGPPARLIRRLAGSPVAGTALNLLSVAAAPDVFVLQRWVDLAGSAGDPGALAVHARVDRWTLDEFPLPGRLFEDIVEQLYREDRFRNGTLDVGGDTAGAAQLDVPVLAVVNPAGRIVAPESMLDLETLRPGLLSRVLHCEREWGPGLQHVAPLVGPIAHRQLWPQIAAWMQALR
ncbi:MAG TPA: alpha/beta fold hydrolase, partial [Burkholderiaceae bacterium]|nr:alpha/beta fold hydrolase [Burkholderiaceae bacterium]